jgi:hypothetical protein
LGTSDIDSSLPTLKRNSKEPLKLHYVINEYNVKMSRSETCTGLITFRAKICTRAKFVSHNKIFALREMFITSTLVAGICYKRTTVVNKRTEQLNCAMGLLKAC